MAYFKTRYACSIQSLANYSHDGIESSKTDRNVSMGVTSNARSKTSTTKQVKCFRTTVVICPGGSRALKVTQVLIDTGADITLIDRRIVQSAGLRTVKVEPMFVTIADGQQIVCNEVVHFQLWIAGVCNHVTAYINKSETDNLLLIGVDTANIFRMVININYGRNAGWKVTVSEDVTYRRAIRHIVEQDPVGRGPRYSLLDREVAIGWSMRHGLTRMQRLDAAARLRAHDQNLYTRNAFFDGSTDNG